MKSISFFIFLLNFSFSFSQAPDWVEPSMRNMKYPENQFLTGFASELNVKKEEQAELLKRIENYAKTRLNESVIVNVQSVSNMDLTESNNVIVSYFKSSASSYSNLNLAGLKVETYYDSKLKTGYAFAFAKKSEVQSLYKNQISSKKEKVIETFKLAQQMVSAGNNQKALENYFSCYPVLREIEEAQSVLAALNVKNLNQENLDIVGISKIKVSIDSSVNALYTNKNLFLGDQAYFLAFAIKSQVGDLKQPIRLSNLTYQDTRMGSPFSRRFASELEQKMVAAGIDATSDIGIPGQDESATPFLLTGTYWDDGDFIKLVVIIRNIQTAKLIASAEGKVAKSVLESSNLTYLPENFKDAMANQKMFIKDEIVGGDLNVEIYTNKGKDNLIFTGGDKMKLFVRANKECFLRVIYHMADGSKVLLLDSYYISNDKVNVLYELPYEFECSEPFGAETLQLNAQTKAFEPIQTRNENGYDFITDDLGTTLVATRGFKRIDNQVQKAEKRLVITTMTP